MGCETGKRIVVCEACGGDGGWDEPISHDPFTDTIQYASIPCETCHGTGEYEVEDEPIDEDDLDDPPISDQDGN